MKNASGPIDRLARLGFAARAVVYGLIGWFGLLVPLGLGGKLLDPQNTLRELLSQPFGSVFLLALGLGLFAYAIWRILQAWHDFDGFGNDLKGIVIRIGHALGGVLHAVLGFSAINLVFHLTSTSAPQGSERRIAAWVLSQEFGQWLLIVVAAGIFVFAVGTIYNALAEKFARWLAIPHEREWLMAICKVGLISRGLVFGIIGWMFLKAAWDINSREAGGLKGVWDFLGNLPFGNGLIAIVSLGFVAFSVYGFTEAYYRRPITV